MTKSLCLLALLSMPGAFAGQDASPTVDEIVAGHLEARGGAEALRAIQTLVYSGGTYTEGDYTNPGGAFMAYKRPYYRLVGNPENPGGFMEGYDGSTWEWYANPGVVVRTVGAASGAIRRGSVLGGPFLDYEERGTTITLGEPEEIDGRPAHRLTVTLRDGSSSDAFLDQETLLVVAGRHTAPVHAFGDPVTSETRFYDYEPVAGVLFSHRNVGVELATGEVMSTMHWGSIEANRELPTEWFSPPVYERSPLQGFLERLYMERTDAAAVLWSYVDFRRAHPRIHTRAGVDFIGYQMLKMGSVQPAIALLEANARDYPHVPGPEFELGRAHATAGDLETARWHYEKALLIDPGYEPAARALEALD